MVFFVHQNKCRPALHIEVSSLCIGDSSFKHVLMHSPTVPRLARIHQKTITLHSLPKRGIVVWRSGMWGIGILMHPGFLFCIMIGIVYVSPTQETGNSIQKLNGVLVCSSYFDHTGGHGGTHDSSFRKVDKQSSYLFTQQDRPEMQGMKIDYLPWSCFDSLQPHVIAISCKTAKTGGVLNEIGRWRSDRFSTCFYGWAWHPLWICKQFDLAKHGKSTHKSTGSTAAFKIHGKSNHILFPIWNRLTMMLLWIHSGTPRHAFLTLPMAHIVDGNGISVQVAGFATVSLHSNARNLQI
jgi:hypothetical protein